jgi:hypothetical protein
MRCSILFLMLVIAVLAAISPIAAQTSSPMAERTSVDLTVYNQNLSLIREERTVSIAKGLSHIIIPEIPATIDGTSLHFKSATEPDAVRVLEQNYQYDLVNQSKLLEKYIGKDVEFIRTNPETKKEYTVVGRLLSVGPQVRPLGGEGSPINDLVAEINGKVEIDPAGRLVLPAIPEGLVLKPQLDWLVSNTRPGEHKAEISYLAGGLSWNANYVALLSSDDASIDLTGWVTLSNNSGTSFKNAGLKLVAGDVNMVRQEFDQVMTKNMSMRAEAAAPQFKQTDLFEYKLYSLQRRTDLRNDETKQIELVSGRNATATKMFIYDGIGDQWRYWRNNYSYRNQGSFGQQSNQKVGVYVTFRNDEKSGLGLPLPKGTIRVYKRDTDGKEQFIGEDQIDHTPKDEELRLYLGNAFDIVGERAQTDFHSNLKGNTVEETIQIKVRNHKEEPATVQVYEHPWRWSQWEIVKSSSDFIKIDQSTIRFPVKIAKDEEKIVTYTIRYTW